MQGQYGYSCKKGDDDAENVVFFQSERAPINEIGNQAVNKDRDQVSDRIRLRWINGEYEKKYTPWYECFVAEKRIGNLSRVFGFVFVCGIKQSEICRGTFNKDQDKAKQFVCIHIEC